MNEKWLIVYLRMNEIVSQNLTPFPTPIGGFSSFSWWPLIFHFLRCLLYSDIVLPNMYVHFHHRFFIAHVLFNAGVFVICMMPLPYLPNCPIFFTLRSFCEIIVTLHLIQLPFFITPRSLSSCNGKQFGVLRQEVNLLARKEELRRRNPNIPHIEVTLQYYRNHLGRNKIKYDHTDSKWCRLCYIHFNHELQVYKWSVHSR